MQIFSTILDPPILRPGGQEQGREAEPGGVAQSPQRLRGPHHQVGQDPEDPDLEYLPVI